MNKLICDGCEEEINPEGKAEFSFVKIPLLAPAYRDKIDLCFSCGEKVWNYIKKEAGK